MPSFWRLETMPASRKAILVLPLFAFVLLTVARLAGRGGPTGDVTRALGVTSKDTAIVTLPITNCVDTWISNEVRDANFCTSPTLWIGHGTNYRALLRFDLSKIPPSAGIVTAKLWLYADRLTGPSGRRRIRCYRLNRDWTCSATTWCSPWDTTVECMNGGGLYDQVVRSWVDLEDAGLLSLDVTEYVKYWEAQPAENYGMILLGEESLSGWCEFASAESAQMEHQPMLEILYDIGPSRTPTYTPIPTATNTPATPTATNTPVRPTATDTPVTPTATNTPVTPTPTSAPTSLFCRLPVIKAPCWALVKNGGFANSEDGGAPPWPWTAVGVTMDGKMGIPEPSAHFAGKTGCLSQPVEFPVSVATARLAFWYDAWAETTADPVFKVSLVRDGDSLPLPQCSCLQWRGSGWYPLTCSLTLTECVWITSGARDIALTFQFEPKDLGDELHLDNATLDVCGKETVSQ